MGGGFMGEWIQVYVWLSPITVHLRLPQHCQLIILQYKIKSLKLKIRIHFLLYFSLNISNTQIEACFIFILFIFPEIFYVYQNMFILGLPCWLSGKDSACQCGRYRFDPWVRKISWRRKWQPTPVFLSRKSHEQRSLAVCSPWGRRKVGHDSKNGPIT